MNAIRYKNKEERLSSARCRRNHNKTVAHKRYGGSTPLLCACTLLLSIALLSACPDDADNNNGGNTPTEFRYTCENGTAVDGTTTDQDAQQNCMVCDDGYAPVGTQCVQAFQYTCENGTAVDGTTTDQDAQQNCMVCDDGYAPSGTQCLPGVQFMCEDGVGVTTLDMSATTTDTDCVRCNDGHVLYTINGTKRQECARDTFDTLSNGVTVICPGMSVGVEFDIAGITYTKRNKDEISTDNAATTCTTDITNMSLMFFDNGTFNEDISHWDVSKVDDMNNMFNTASAFNQDIGHWDVSRVTNMNALFATASAFDQDIGNWDVGKVSDMSGMFNDAAMFNQDISGWDVSKVSDMSGMFSDAAMFNQDLSGWCVSSISSEPSSFNSNSLLTMGTSPQWGTCP